LASSSTSPPSLDASKNAELKLNESATTPACDRTPGWRSLHSNPVSYFHPRTGRNARRSGRKCAGGRHGKCKIGGGGSRYPKPDVSCRREVCLSMDDSYGPSTPGVSPR
jgi:hypothetical protein